MKEMLAQLPYGPGPSYSMPQNTTFQAELSEAIDTYSQARDEALKLLYKNKEASQATSVDVAADFEESEQALMPARSHRYANLLQLPLPVDISRTRFKSLQMR